LPGGPAYFKLREEIIKRRDFLRLALLGGTTAAGRIFHHHCDRAFHDKASFEGDLDGTEELYDHENDPNESYNVADRPRTPRSSTD
jgi:hypothetical protein